MNDLSITIENAKRELEQMIDLNPQVMLLTDENCRIRRANKALLNLLSLYDFKDILNKNLQDLFKCDDDNFFNNLIKENASNEGKKSEVCLLDGKELILLFTIVNSGTKDEPIAIVITDVTNDSQHAVAIEQEHKKQAVKALAGALMHNINQPLTVIMMRAQLALLALENRSVSPDETKKGLHDIMHLTMSIADTIKSVENSHDYSTSPYYRNVEILDIKKPDLSASSKLISPMITTLVEAQENRFPGSIAHSDRTAEISIFIAQLLELSNDQIDILKRSAELHDIGKLAIAGKILSKNGPLTPDEMEHIKKHVEFAYRILLECDLGEEAEIVYAHHERPDGKGYPRGLKNEDIPLNARIVSIADSFAVMHDGRNYKSPMTIENILHELQEHSGTQFDNNIVDVLNNNRAKIEAFFKEKRPARP